MRVRGTDLVGLEAIILGPSPVHGEQGGRCLLVCICCKRSLDSFGVQDGYIGTRLLTNPVIKRAYRAYYSLD
jgi:hypothetical protein